MLFRKNSPGKLLLFVLMVSYAALLPGTARAEYDYINITNPFIKKQPVAVPRFKAMGQDAGEEKIAEDGSRMLEELLTFTRYFAATDRAAFLEEPSRTGIVGSRINFRNWTAIGAELLVTGGVLAAGDNLKIELRLFDTFRGRMLTGKIYTGGKKDVRKMVRRFAGEVVRLLTGSPGIFDSRIAFVSTATGGKEIFVCDFDGHGVRRETFDRSIVLSPAWGEGGRRLAYTSYKRGKPDLYIKNVAEKLGRVVDLPGLNISPAWVPGQPDRLAATLSYSGDQEIYLLTRTGKIIKRLTRSWGIDVSPAFSPDGKKMAFVSKRSGTPQVHVMDLDTGQVRRLTYEGRYNQSPAWSPKGDRIAFVGMRKNKINIYAIDADGQNQQQLTADSGDNESPSWSPDGSLIAFSSTREGTSRIYVMTAFGTDQRRLLSQKGAQTTPRWSPNVKK